jgi:gluconolactonase
MSELPMTEITSGLRFPEGPIAMPDGTVLVVQLGGGCVTRVHPDGRQETVAEPGGSPNGLAMGPDGAGYVCNSGGWEFHDIMGFMVPGTAIGPSYTYGRIERIDLDSGETKVLYRDCDGNRLIGPNDIVFDSEGGFWFTDHGRNEGRVHHLGAIFYAQPDGSSIREVVFPVDSPNGIGLSPDGSRLYAAETHTGRVYAWNVSGPGQIDPVPGSLNAGELLCGLPGMQLFDSLGIDGDGNVVVATLVTGALTVISPEGEVLDQVLTGDPMTTNVCFGGNDLRTAYITASGTGRLLSTQWPRPGLKLAF